MSTGLVEIMKRSAMDAFEASKPCDLRVGKVTKTSPLTIEITNLLPIPKSMLIVPQYLTDFEVEVSIDPGYGWNTINKAGGSGEDAFASHNHDIYFGRKKIKIHNALKVGDRVVLIRQAGGQKFFVLDRWVEE